MIGEDAFHHRMRAETAPVRKSARAKAVAAHYDLSAGYLELIYGVVDHVSRAGRG